jgi:predicted phosphodiesterase
MAGLTWLHLSDWHQKGKEFDREVVRDKLIEDLERRTEISANLAKIDFIIFSGDVAHSAKPEEYNAAKKELFEPVLKATGLDSDKLFIVPGNHDLNREELEDLPSAALKPFDSNVDVEKWLVDERKRRLLLEPFHAFSEFVTAITGQEKPEYANFRILVIEKKRVALLGLNSAWMCGRHLDSKGEVDDERYVLVGEPQIHESLRQISKADIRIAILHHPFDWMTKFDRDKIESRLMSESDFILRGHQHQPQVSVIKSTLGNCVIIPAGASYYRRKVDDLSYSNAYNFVHLDFDSGRCIVFLRCWSNSLNKWREDIDSHPDGLFEFNISKLIPAQLHLADSQISEIDMSIKQSSGRDSKSFIPHQIPPPPADFTGRVDELKDLLDHFNTGATITGLRGMGGIGKTALAFTLVEELSDRYPDGQIMVDMNGTSDEPLTPAEAMAQIIHAYDPEARLPVGESELIGLYRSKLHGKRALLLLDNAVDDVQIRPLLPPSSCGLIVTSRQKFTLPGLIEKDLNVMPFPDARALLLKIASRIGDNAGEMAKLCGYLPLALRAASSLLANELDLSPVDYVKELRIERTRLERIGGEGVDLDVEASFNLSYRRLKPEERRVFRLLPIFRADFDATAEDYLCKDKGHKIFEQTCALEPSRFSREKKTLSFA